ncbi:hypothetical protein [Carnobacterium maltaromaticum]|uniref:hypothetical protein n=1 Tax=Carnobacterium maltaromaticum TaxID=2751 RepID=UPI001F31E1C3|nr:hypothetical protein [Carnobacterium maltaromaticum]
MNELDLLDELMKTYNKNVQKVKVRAIGRSGNQSRKSKKTTIKNAGKQESKLAKDSISKTTTGLQSTVKGQFSKKITTILDQQKTTLDGF